jgi:hypothetical protein
MESGCGFSWAFIELDVIRVLESRNPLLLLEYIIQKCFGVHSHVE